MKKHVLKCAVLSLILALSIGRYAYAGDDHGGGGPKKGSAATSRMQADTQKTSSELLGGGVGRTSEEK